MKLTDIILKEFNQELSLPGQSLPIVKKLLERVCGPGRIEQYQGFGRGPYDFTGRRYSFYPDNPEKLPTGVRLPKDIDDKLTGMGWGALVHEDRVEVEQVVDWTPVDTTGGVVIHVAGENLSDDYLLKTGFRTKDDGTRNLKATYGVLLPKNYSHEELEYVLEDLHDWMDFSNRDVYAIDLDKYRLPWYLDLLDRQYGGFPAIFTVSNIPGSCLRRIGSAKKILFPDD